jgi:hypothetical protein
MTSCFPDPGLDFPEAVEMLEAGRLDVSALLTHTVPLAQALLLPLTLPPRRSLALPLDRRTGRRQPYGFTWVQSPQQNTLRQAFSNFMLNAGFKPMRLM